VEEAVARDEPDGWPDSGRDVADAEDMGGDGEQRAEGDETS